MELLKIQLQDAGRVVATLKAAGQVSIYHSTLCYPAHLQECYP
jgi:hypothetical protein